MYQFLRSLELYTPLAFRPQYYADRLGITISGSKNRSLHFIKSLQAWLDPWWFQKQSSSLGQLYTREKDIRHEVMPKLIL